jgi:large subunit ribosomal protein L18
MDKKLQRLRRARKSRARIKELGMYRLCVHKTPRHTYAQIIEPVDSKVVASASTLEADIKKDLKNTANVEAATKIGTLIAERAKASGVEQVAFDRSGNKYHGRVKALADAARENGLQF